MLAVVWMGVAMATDVVQCCSVGMWVACQLAKPSVSSLGHNAAMFTTVGPSPHPLGAVCSPPLTRASKEMLVLALVAVLAMMVYMCTNTKQ